MKTLVNLELARIYVDLNIISQGDINKIINDVKNNNIRLDKYLLDENLVSEEKNAIVYSKMLGMNYIALEQIKYDANVVQMVTEIFIKKYYVIPLTVEDDCLIIAITDPFKREIYEKIYSLKYVQYKIVITTKEKIDKIKNIVFSKATTIAALKRYTSNETKEREGVTVTEGLKGADVANSPIVKLADSIISEGVAIDASDIHIEPYEDEIRVRYRVDGVLYVASTFEIGIYPALSTRIKIIAGLNITEKRLPQDGRIKLKINNIYYDFRVSTLPSVYGEKIAIRILDVTAFEFTRNQLGFLDEENKIIDKTLKLPHGMILLTGPTGCGKSTTLYSFIKELNQNSKNIITVEDPVEYTIKGVNQVQVNPKANLTFATSLRSILRQDPNIIMIGEIRDEETAEIAIRASITGHLVLSTLHTNDASGAIARLIDMGIEPYFVSDAISMIVAQRLVRKLCDKCKVGRMTNASEMKILNLNKEEKIYHPVGCPVCNHTGYKGRTGVHEILNVNSGIKRMIQENKSTEEVKKVALEGGMLDLKATTTKKVLYGETSLNELLNIVYEVQV